MFYYAQKAVLHPTAPLFSAETKEVCEIRIKSHMIVNDQNKNYKKNCEWELLLSPVRDLSPGLMYLESNLLKIKLKPTLQTPL